MQSIQSMDVSLLVWVLTIGAILALVAVDLFTVSAHPHQVKFKEATAWSIFYIGIALAFGAWVWNQFGSTYGTQYFGAYLVEKSLSVDNLFIFVIILAQFAVPPIYHQRVLLFGVVLALVLRSVFIALGAAALAAFAFTFVLFGAILIWTGIGLFRHWDEDPDPNDNVLVRTVRKRVAMVDEYHGTKMFIKLDGKRFATPMFMVMIAIATTDLLFALDSIPATFGITSEAYLVFAANAFALLGLRALYFLIKGLLDRLIYLSLGLSVILIFIGVKLIWNYVYYEKFISIPKIQTNVSLLVILVILVITTVLSLLKSSRNPEMKATAGRMGDPFNDDQDPKKLAKEKLAKEKPE
jgi:tellurite resistance protein TerC